MPTNDGFVPNYPLPRFLSRPADRREQPGIGRAGNRTVTSSRVDVMTSTLIGMATAIGILTVGDPVALFADVKTSLLDISRLQFGVGQSTPAIQSPPAPQNLPPTASDAPTRHEIATAPEPADQSQTKISQPSTEDLFKQYQVWVAYEEKGAKVEPVQPVRDAPEQVVQVARPKLEIMKTHRQVRRVRHARADIQNSRRRVRQTQNARVQVRPI